MYERSFVISQVQVASILINLVKTIMAGACCCCSKVYIFTWGGLNKKRAGIAHPLCKAKPDPYFHSWWGTNA